jgi:hypothetical protein
MESKFKNTLFLSITKQMSRSLLKEFVVKNKANINNCFENDLHGKQVQKYTFPIYNKTNI